MQLEQYIRDVKDFPKEGIVFKDITTLLKDGAAWQETINQMVNALQGVNFDYIIGIESRGFIFASALAYIFKKGFIPVRKKGKLPAKTLEETYELEYGTDTLCIHEDAIGKGDKVIIIDDLLATGGTVGAVNKLVEKTGATVEKLVFLVELDFLKGREKIPAEKVISLIHY
jgi:adenine phosphoribosyltransferase